MPPQLRDRKHATPPPTPDSVHSLQQQSQKHQRLHFKRPSALNRFYLAGGIHRPIDLVFLLSALLSILWTVAFLILVEVPYLIWTEFSTSTRQHPVSWGWIYSFCMAVSRASSSHTINIAHLRLVSTIISWFTPLRMRHLRHYNFREDVGFKVHLDTLLQPERKTLFETRDRLGLTGIKYNPANPSPELLASFLRDPEDKDRLANMPEESGHLDRDGTYTLQGEWIEVLDDPTNPDPRPRSNVVLMHFHGGGYAFCSPKFHRQLITRMALELGPGARAFVVDYRMAPEHPMPASIHDAYATFLYLTQPDHEAITSLGTPTRPVDPKDVILSGDSAGGGLAIAFLQYMRDYVQPSVEAKFEMPRVNILLSPWVDISTSMPSACAPNSYCYIPGPMGVNPFADQAISDAFPKFNFAKSYLCGDANLVPNERNAVSKLQEWEWYRHLAQHPLVSSVYTANLAGLGGSTLLQTGAFDRLFDDTKLLAHKMAEANPNDLIRFELYRDMVHVHQFFEFLPLADQAVRAIAEFIKRADLQQRKTVSREGPEWIVVDTDGATMETFQGCTIASLEACWKPEQTFAPLQ